MRVILIGFMGAGKTSVARLLDANYLDTDELLVEKFGQSISDYAAEFGTEKFRQQEEKLLAELLNSSSASPIATGGGIVESARNQKLLAAHGQVVYLQADFPCLLERIKNDTDNQRFIFQNSDPEVFEQKYKKRLPIYEHLADLTLDTTDLTPAETAKIIREKFPI
ncbi:shikimate kinase [Lactovum odontotermitis]